MPSFRTFRWLPREGVDYSARCPLYRRGYFRQFLDVDGTQQHHYPILDVSRLPVRPV